MNLTELRTRVYDILEEDEDGVPTALIDLFAVDGFEQLVAADRRWPYYQSTADLNVVGSTADYALPLKEVTRVIRTGDKYKLDVYNHADAVTDFTADDPDTPLFYSVWGNRLHLWPVPANSETLKVVGYRDAVSPTADISAQFDIDPEFHNAILYWTLSRYYARIEDTEISAFWANEFARSVANAQTAVLNRNNGDDLVQLSYGVRNVVRTPQLVV